VLGGRIFGGAEFLEPAPESPGGAVDSQDFGVVEEAVEDRGGEYLVAEQLGPLGRRLV
jgi:hypothetical protein